MLTYVKLLSFKTELTSEKTFKVWSIGHWSPNVYGKREFTSVLKDDCYSSL